MKSYFNVFFTSLLLITLQSPLINAQDARDLLEKTIAHCESVTQGYYSMTLVKKYMSKADTSTSHQACYFKKLPDDDLYGFAFHSTWPSDVTQNYRFYTGHEMVWVDQDDSTATITSVEKWKQHLKNVMHNYDFFDPVTSPSRSVLPDKKDFKSRDYKFKYQGEETVHGIPCYRVARSARQQKIEGMGYLLRNETNYWIAKKDYMLVQFDAAYDIVMANDTMYQYDKTTIDSFSYNTTVDDSRFSLTAIPEGIALQDFTEAEDIPLLSAGSQAPAWKWPSLANDSISLSSFQGNIVLVDFFYKSCFPCMQALPALESLHKKYESKGLRVIGINPYDKKADELSSFLEKRGVTYPIVLSEKEFPAIYHVTGYPTLYIIDKSGTIIHAQAGYGEGTEDKLEKIILKHL